ncbi:MAG: hypothetical protein AB1679_26095 [Actinomycetota bacterium]
MKTDSGGVTAGAGGRWERVVDVAGVPVVVMVGGAVVVVMIGAAAVVAVDAGAGAWTL